MSTPQTFRCRACGYSWGPVGVEPFVPDAEQQQLFLVCDDCDTPSVVKGKPGEIAFVCRDCGADGYKGLVVCPDCGSDQTGWGPV